MSIALYPGSFDPPTLGHIDIIRRGANLFDEVVVAIKDDLSDRPTFSVAERQKMLEKCLVGQSHVRIIYAKGLTIDTAHQVGAKVMLRGVRAIMDFEHELQQATSNMILAPEIETLFLLSKPEHSFMSSSAVKQIAQWHGNLEKFVPEAIIDDVRKKYR